MSGARGVLRRSPQPHVLDAISEVCRTPAKLARRSAVRRWPDDLGRHNHLRALDLTDDGLIWVLGLPQGPPGTGKTKFIAAFVHWLATERKAERILITSQSHEAVLPNG